MLQGGDRTSLCLMTLQDWRLVHRGSTECLRNRRSPGNIHHGPKLVCAQMTVERTSRILRLLDSYLYAVACTGWMSAVALGYRGDDSGPGGPVDPVDDPSPAPQPTDEPFHSVAGQSLVGPPGSGSLDGAASRRVILGATANATKRATDTPSHPGKWLFNRSTVNPRIELQHLTHEGARRAPPHCPAP